MSDVHAHYEQLLAKHYTWMLGGRFDDLVVSQRDLLTTHGVARGDQDALALDLGCGSGIQSIALAQMGYGTVLSVDSSETLIAELAERAAAFPAVRPVLADLCNGLEAVTGPGTVSTAVCMGDTLPHLPDADAVRRLFEETLTALRPGGQLVLSFRDLSMPLTGESRFLPIRLGDDRIMTCFLEDEGDKVRVHDLIHSKDDDGTWRLNVSSYAKLRLSPRWVIDELAKAGFVDAALHPGPRGLSVVVARSPEEPR